MMDLSKIRMCSNDNNDNNSDECPLDDELLDFGATSKTIEAKNGHVGK